MSFRSSALVGLSLGLILAACGSAPAVTKCPASCASPEVQKIVESVAKEHPELVRLTVHAKGKGCDQFCAIASTVPAKICKLSDPEDLEAMNTGKPVVLDEVGAVDVTLPAIRTGAQWTSAIGVTFRPNAAMKREQFVDLAAAIAKVVEDRMRALPK